MTRHARDYISLFFGLLFVLSGILFLSKNEDWPGAGTAVTLAGAAAVMAVIGIIVLVAGAIRSRDDDDAATATDSLVSVAAEDAADELDGADLTEPLPGDAFLAEANAELDALDPPTDDFTDKA